METSELENIKHVINGDYIVIPIETGYIKPNDNLDCIIHPARELMKDNDYLVIAETPISVSQNRLVDEAEYTPSLTAKFLTVVWSKYLWGYVLGPILGIKPIRKWSFSCMASSMRSNRLPKRELI